MKMISREEANLTTWLLSQVNLIESQTGKKISKLELVFDGTTGGSGINLVYEETAPSE